MFTLVARAKPKKSPRSRLHFQLFIPRRKEKTTRTEKRVMSISSEAKWACPKTRGMINKDRLAKRPVFQLRNWRTRE